MVDFRIVVIRATSQYNAVHSVLFYPFQGFHTLVVDIFVKLLVFSPCDIYRSINFSLRGSRARAHKLRMLLDELDVQALLQFVLHVVGNKRIQELDIGLVQRINIEFQRLGITHYDRAIEMIACGLVFLTFILRARHPDEIDVFIKQVHDMAMRKFGWVAHAFRRHRLDTRFVRLLG